MFKVQRTATLFFTSERKARSSQSAAADGRPSSLMSERTSIGFHWSLDPVFR